MKFIFNIYGAIYTQTRCPASAHVERSAGNPAGSQAREDGVKVCVWNIPLDFEANDQSLRHCLSEEERSVFKLFTAPEQRLRYARSHGAARRILGACLGLKPEDVPICRDSFGKPFIKGRPLHFSLSHSGAVCLLAICRDRPLGVDVEPVVHCPEADLIARRFFSAGERAWLASSKDPERDFLRLWVCREALGKVMGEGLAIFEKAKIVDVSGGTPVCSDQYLLTEFEPHPGYAAAVACLKKNFATEYF